MKGRVGKKVALANKRGVYKGRKQTPTPEQAIEARQRVVAGAAKIEEGRGN